MTITTGHYLYGLSALSRYFGCDLPDFSFELIEGSIVDIARVIEDIRYPGVDEIDAACMVDDTEHLFHCVDSVDQLKKHPLNVMNFFYNKRSDRFLDRADCYYDIRNLRLDLLSDASTPTDLTIQNLLEAAALVSCFGFKPEPGLIDAFSGVIDASEDIADSAGRRPSPLVQRMYLSAVLAGEYPAAGLGMLKDFGVVELLWPELHALCGLDQAKEYHPEGDVWDHSLETLYHRKTNDLELSFALLLHDIGKPLASEENGNRFNNHAQIGRNAAAAFLGKLEFPEHKIDKICFLVENHMLPAAIETLPTFRTERAMSSPYFPLLLEVYRCDLLSTFQGPEGYYKACKVYRAFIKNVKNPFRGSDGKKLYRLYVD